MLKFEGIPQHLPPITHLPKKYASIYNKYVNYFGNVRC